MALTWKKIRNGMSAQSGDRTYYIGTFHGDIHASYRTGTSMNLVHIKWGGIADIESAMAIAELHNSSSN